MGNPVPGWNSVVQQGLTESPLLLGVPLIFCLLNILVALGLALVWLPWLVVAAGLHGLARLGTAYDLHWMEVLIQHVSYRSYYKG